MYDPKTCPVVRPKIGYRAFFYFLDTGLICLTLPHIVEIDTAFTFCANHGQMPPCVTRMSQMINVIQFSERRPHQKPDAQMTLYRQPPVPPPVLPN
jgi:hypothetical protein